jgi:hypothetical protein
MNEILELWKMCFFDSTAKGENCATLIFRFANLEHFETDSSNLIAI